MAAATMWPFTHALASTVTRALEHSLAAADDGARVTAWHGWPMHTPHGCAAYAVLHTHASQSWPAGSGHDLPAQMTR
eukprot:4825197-Alexandrium_andersonii.AAC.1